MKFMLRIDQRSNVFDLTSHIIFKNLKKPQYYIYSTYPIPYIAFVAEDLRLHKIETETVNSAHYVGLSL